MVSICGVPASMSIVIVPSGWFWQARYIFVSGISLFRKKAVKLDG
jgi:hypothetical protein